MTPRCLAVPTPCTETARRPQQSRGKSETVVETAGLKFSAGGLSRRDTRRDAIRDKVSRGCVADLEAGRQTALNHKRGSFASRRQHTGGPQRFIFLCSGWSRVLCYLRSRLSDRKISHSVHSSSRPDGVERSKQNSGQWPGPKLGSTASKSIDAKCFDMAGWQCAHCKHNSWPAYVKCSTCHRLICGCKVISISEWQTHLPMRPGLWRQRSTRRRNFHLRGSAARNGAAQEGSSRADAPSRS